MEFMMSTVKTKVVNDAKLASAIKNQVAELNTLLRIAAQNNIEPVLTSHKIHTPSRIRGNTFSVEVFKIQGLQATIL